MLPRLLLVFLLGGCAQWDAAVTGIAQYSAGAADREIDASVWAVCQAASVGSIRREFNTQERMDAYNKFCITAQKVSEVGISVLP